MRPLLHKCIVPKHPISLFYSISTCLFLQSVTVTATQTSVTSTWRCIWPLEMSAEECVTTVCITLWDATVRCANLSTIKTLSGISGTHKSVLVSHLFFEQNVLRHDKQWHLN